MEEEKFYKVDEETIQKNEEALASYAEYRQKCLKHKGDPFFDAMLDILDVSAEIVNGQGGWEEVELQDTLYFYLS